MKPIIFNTEMVRAILDGRKTQTRRVVKPQPRGWFGKEWVEAKYKCPYPVGTLLWVRETWRLEVHSAFHDIGYKADGYIWDPGTKYQSLRNQTCWTWRPSIHMPRWASRITLEVTNVRVERLQEVSVEDAIKEGIPPFSPNGNIKSSKIPRLHFSSLWDSINGKKYPWESNPWVFVIAFSRFTAP